MFTHNDDRDDDVQVGCFSLRNIFRRKRASVASSSSSRTPHSHAGHTHQALSEKMAADAHRFGSCCHFAHEGSDAKHSSNDAWLRSPSTTPSPPPGYPGERKDPSPRKADVDLYRPEFLSTIEETIHSLDSELRALSLDIHSHPEIMYQEKCVIHVHGYQISPRHDADQML
jgi:hypothetical protein